MPDQLKQAISIELKPSFLLLSLLLSIAILSSISVEKLPLAGALKWGLFLLIVLSTAYYILRDAMIWLPWSWQSLVVNVRGELSITNKQGQTFKPGLANDSFIHPKLIILNFKRLPGLTRLPACILITPPVDGQSARRLRVWLQWWQFDHGNASKLLTAASDYHAQ